MSFFTKIRDFFRLLYNSVFGRAVLDVATQLIAVVGKLGADMLMVEAQRAILDAENKFPAPGSGLEKRGEVAAYLKARATEAGFSLAGNLLNFIIESALAKLKDEGAVGGSGNG